MTEPPDDDGPLPSTAELDAELEELASDQTLRSPFTEGLELAVDLALRAGDAGGSTEWLRAYWGALLLDAQANAGRFEPGLDEIRVQASGFLALLLLTYLGGTPHPAMVREVERRVGTLQPGAVRCAGDALWFTDDSQVDHARVTLEIGLRVVAAFDPARARE